MLVIEGKQGKIQQLNVLLETNNFDLDRTLMLLYKKDVLILNSNIHIINMDNNRDATAAHIDFKNNKDIFNDYDNVVFFLDVAEINKESFAQIEWMTKKKFIILLQNNDLKEVSCYEVK
ncbi:hypothetical protein [Bacillus mycoides]|uniref:hypothetical protein n=1 Tax=Bacillus mycoides TaxID=1405 RepID=UPI003D65654C